MIRQGIDQAASPPTCLNASSEGSDKCERLLGSLSIPKQSHGLLKEHESEFDRSTPLPTPLPERLFSNH